MEWWKKKKKSHNSRERLQRLSILRPIHQIHLLVGTMNTIAHSMHSQFMNRQTNRGSDCCGRRVHRKKVTICVKRASWRKWVLRPWHLLHFSSECLNKSTWTLDGVFVWHTFSYHVGSEEKSIWKSVGKTAGTLHIAFLREFRENNSKRSWYP